MAGSTENLTPVANTLDELYALVCTDAMQPVNQYAEHAVVYWLQVVDGKDVLQPRLNEGGYVPGAFHFGLEQEHGNRIDSETPGRTVEAGREAFASRLHTLKGKLEEYFTQSGYRSSSEHCDQIMLEVSHFSRFISACCMESEILARTHRENAGSDVAAKNSKIQSALAYTRRNLFIWEPTLNDIIVSWMQNALSEFDRALRELDALMALDESGREAYHVLPGYPLRPRGRPRSRVTVVNPVLRPLRTKPMFIARIGQLLRRLEELGSLPGETAQSLNEDMRHFTTMVRNNHFMLASEPSFWDRHRAGMPLIRGRPTTHPFLQDPADFFKKAVLFHNRTYTVAGGGVDRFYLQVKQLERFFRFQSSGGVHALQSKMDKCLRGWEENRWDAFTEGLLQLAERLRRQSASAG